MKVLSLSEDSHKKFLRESAEIYEQVLEKIPDDKFSIEALIDIYVKVGDQDKVDDFEAMLKKIDSGQKLTIETA